MFSDIRFVRSLQRHFFHLLSPCVRLFLHALLNSRLCDGFTNRLAFFLDSRYVAAPRLVLPALGCVLIADGKTMGIIVDHEADLEHARVLWSCKEGSCPVCEWPILCTVSTLVFLVTKMELG